MRKLLIGMTLLAICGTLCGAAETVRTWDGGGPGGNANIWSTGNNARRNWDGDSAFASGSGALFVGANTGTNITISGSFTVGSITFTASATNYSFSGSATLTLANGLTNLSALSQRFSGSVLTLALGAAQTWNSAFGDLLFSTAVNNSGNQLTLGGTGTISLDGGLGGAGALVVTNSGLRRITAATSFTGSTTVSGGTLELATDAALGGTPQIILETGGTLLLAGSGGNNRINNSAALNAAGGTFNVNGLSETLGALTLSASSTLDFGSGSSTVTFANSSAAGWTSGQTLTLASWTSGSDQLFFGNSASGLTGGQLSQISFLNPSGFAPGNYAANILGSGQVVPVPEVTPWIAPLALGGWAGFAAWRSRRPRKG